MVVQSKQILQSEKLQSGETCPKGELWSQARKPQNAPQNGSNDENFDTSACGCSSVAGYYAVTLHSHPCMQTYVSSVAASWAAILAQGEGVFACD